MKKVGIRELRQHASRVVATAAAGEIITITDRGRAVARMTPVHGSPLQNLIDAGLARPAKHALHDLAAPEGGPCLSDNLGHSRAAERY